MFARSGKRKDQDSKDIVKWHTPDDHERCDRCFAIDILDKGQSEDSSTATIAALDKFADNVFIFQEKRCTGHNNGKADQSGKKAIQNIACVPDTEKVCLIKIQKQKRGQCHLEVEFIGDSHETVIQHMDLLEHIAYDDR